MDYILSKKYNTPEFMSMIMGPNPIKLEEELLIGNRIPDKAVVCDLGSGQGLTSVFLSKEYGFTVYAADLWSDPDENQHFFDSLNIGHEQLIPVKADATALPFEHNFFDAVVSVDSYNYFGRDEKYLDNCLLPFVKPGGYIYIAIPGMTHDYHDNLPQELLLSWTPEQMDYIHDTAYWTDIVGKSDAEIISVTEMESNDEVWADWLAQDNEYAVGDRKSINAGTGKYLNFIKIILRKKAVNNDSGDTGKTDTDNVSKITSLLDASGIDYELYRHKAVFTIDDMLREELPYPDLIAKNLFVRDDKKLNFYLITVRKNKRVDLKKFAENHGTRKLSFASEDDLMSLLKLKKGSVSPFGLLNDINHKVKFYLDRDFIDTKIGIHPNDNTATVFMRTSDLLSVIGDAVLFDCGQ